MISDIKKIDTAMADTTASEDPVAWIDIDPSDDYVGGLCFNKSNKNFHRLEDDQDYRENLQALSTNTSGEFVEFKTDSKLIRINAKVSSAAYMSHMTAVGTIGFDLYAKVDGVYRFMNVTKVNRAEYTCDLMNYMQGEHEYLLYFPLYINVLSVKLGVTPNCNFSFVNRDPSKPKIIFYGTSILQGGCACRSGMSMSNIFQRHHPEYEVYNFGFSGNAHCDVLFATRLGLIKNVKYMYLEIEMNNGQYLKQRFEPFLTELKKQMPNTRMVLYSRFPNAQIYVHSDLAFDTDDLRAYQKKVFKKYFPDGIFRDGAKVFAHLDYEGTVDGAHLTDYGFNEWEKDCSKVLKKMEKEEKESN